ncbi:MAG: hypothetical protein AAF805_11145, partial [Planctomycetota bacterium]
RRWRAYSTRIEVAGVAVRPSKAGQRELAAAIATLRERDTATRQPTDRVANGSFEQPDASGEAPSDWTTRGAVDRVTDGAESGVASLRMRSTTAERATAAGAPFRTPATGRLVVRLAVKTESAGDDALLGIELTDPQSDYRSQTDLPLGALVAEGSAEETWREILVPIADLPPSDRRTLALRLTLSGAASIRIDGVGTEDTLLPLDGQAGVNLKSEKLALLRLLTAAETALAEGRLAACQRLLDGPLARYVVDHFPPLSEEPQRGPAEPIAPPPAPNVADRDEDADADRPAWSLGRVRDYLPGWWR